MGHFEAGTFYKQGIFHAAIFEHPVADVPQLGHFASRDIFQLDILKTFFIFHILLKRTFFNRTFSSTPTRNIEQIFAMVF